MIQLLQHLIALATPWNFVLVFAGSTIGIIGGALPGITTTLGVALLTSVTFSMQTQDALLMLLSLYVGSVYGGSLTAITINIPGTPSNAATTLDGYPLAQRGEAGPAIGLGTIGSFVGTLLGTFALASVTPLLSRITLEFSSVEYFLLAILGVIVCGSLSAPDLAVKGWMMGFLGLLMATIGMDEIHAFPRYVFGHPQLMDGIAFIPVMIGVFGVPEIIQVMSRREHPTEVPIIKRVLPNLREIRTYWRVVLQSGLVGVGIGIIPGVGEDIASWSAYDAAKRTSKHPEEYGKGSHEGLLASEVGNNSCIGGAIVPLLALGIPGSPPAAILLGAMFLHGLRPGPVFLLEQPQYLSLVVAILLYASFAMLVVGLVVSRTLLIYIVKLPPKVMMSVVATLCVVGAYSLNLNLFDVQMMLLFGIFGSVMRKFKYPLAPFVLGMVLGPMADGNLRRALLVGNGNPLVFVSRPVGLILTIVNVLLLVSQFGLIRRITSRLGKKPDALTSAGAP
ncbi:MAG: tripartite tricarboxylate transporter permease [candidate division NC10 bacterium]|nr:tripartite tricarboxylate transporter permease [candidate division NC10 bacterium]